MGGKHLQEAVPDGAAAVRYQPYPEYKTSGVEWLGDVPEHWGIAQLRHIFDIKAGGDLKEAFFSKVKSDECPYPIYTNSIKSDVAYGYTSKPFFPANTITVTGRGEIGYAVYRDLAYDAIIRLLVLMPKNGKNCKFYSYFINDVLDFYGGNTAVSQLSTEQIKPYRVSILPPEEQQTIAAFLDYKTAKIDALIAKKKALLEKLLEKRTALISYAVTKGLDPKAPMRDSGLEWIGEIPAHWEVKRLRFTMTTNPSKSEIKLQSDEVVSFIPMESVGEFGGLSLDFEKTIDEVSSGYTYFADSDVVVAKITPCFENGKGALAHYLKKGIAFGTTELHVLRAGDGLSSEYLFNLTMTHPFRKIGESEMFGAGGQKRIPERFIKDFRIGIPPIREQNKINEFIQDVKTKLSQEKESVQEVIARLQEYRSALITNAVTGKIDVRNFRLPEVEALAAHE